jgi:hypothetical protein
VLWLRVVGEAEGGVCVVGVGVYSCLSKFSEAATKPAPSSLASWGPWRPVLQEGYILAETPCPSLPSSCNSE